MDINVWSEWLLEGKMYYKTFQELSCFNYKLLPVKYIQIYCAIQYVYVHTLHKIWEQSDVLPDSIYFFRET